MTEPAVSHPEWVVPETCPSLSFALANSQDGTHIKVLPGHVEELTEPLIIDSAVFIEGPPDGSAQLVGSEGIVVNAGQTRKSVVLRNLNLCIEGGVALVIAGGCSVEGCVIEAASVGVEIAAHAGSVVSIDRSLVQRCRVGVSLAGDPTLKLEGTRVEHCAAGVCVTGLQIEEGWNPILGLLSQASLLENSGADLALRSWSIREKSSGIVRRSIPGEEVEVDGWPSQPCSIVVRTDSAAVVLHFSGGTVNATLFEEEGSACGSEPEDADNETAFFCLDETARQDNGEQECLSMQTSTKP